ncbi:MAG: PKD domain-containing protein [Bacteroidota bacterium]
MKKCIITSCISLFLVIYYPQIGKSQIYNGEAAAKIVDGASQLKISETRKTIDYVKLATDAIISTNGMLSWLTKDVLKPIDDISFQLAKSETDNQNYTHYKFNEYYKSFLVEYGVYTVHSKNGFILSANGEFYNHISINELPNLSRDVAFIHALNAVPSMKYKDANIGGIQKMNNEGKLLVLPTDKGFFLAYKFDIYSLEPLRRSYIYIDANSGKVLKEVNRIENTDAHAIANTAYSGNVNMTTDSVSTTSFRLRASKGFGGLRTMNLNTGSDYTTATDFTDADNNWNLTTIDQYAYDAHFGSEATYDFYYSHYGRNSYDNLGAQINAYVHYSVGYVNAFWDGTEMTYGDGDGTNYTPLTSLEVVGHEITHAVTENTAALVYSDESGALNESFSDCFGVAIDYFKNPSTANFLIGDQININGIPFRNMGNPNQFSNPDCYNGLYWNAPNEVHNNSGVQNFWFYLICMGGSGVNDLGDTYTVNPIGINDASAIAYRSLSVYLTPNSTYADARFYSIQAAVDLFGSCSNQVIQITNAWYAVGVGGIFSNAVIAGFNSTQNFFCVVPATVNFINTSMNATNYQWDFGDGNTSTVSSPTHQYTASGTYTVKLIANGTASCSSTDTLILSNYITLTNGGGPISPSCTPTTVSYCCGVGITNVLFGTINHASADASEGYKDFSCGNATTLIAGDPVPISITTGTYTNENVKVWIDYNNDGIFNNSTEQAFASSNHLAINSGIVNTSSSAVLNTALRMRVMDDNATNTITGPCNNPQNGQAEDYTITFIPNTLPPIADFVANVTTINVGGTVYFTDLTQHAPTAWQWLSPGGSPSSSTIQNPAITYNTLGTYSVTLHVSNSFGQDSIVKVAYINVVNSINMCTGITSTTAANGQLYDSGGPAGSYQNNENCSLLIDPGCALSITLSFSQFNTEGGFDYLSVYDGTNVSAPLLYNGAGSTLPPNLTASSGTMFINWYSDVSVTYSGWAATWTSVLGSGNPPVAAFSMSSTNPPLNTLVQFNDATNNNPNSWAWDFGDGQTSIQQNPSHAFASSGTFTVTLIASNCFFSDTITNTISVQSAPTIFLNPNSLIANLNCSDTVSLPVTIYNTGTGSLVYSTGGFGSNNDTVHVLAFMSGTDTAEFSNMVLGINQSFNRYTIQTLYSTVPSVLQTALQGKDVLLFPADEYGVLATYSPYSSIVQAFVSSGKRVILCGNGYGIPDNRMFEMGLFTGNDVALDYGGASLTVLDTTDDITDQVPLTFLSPMVTNYKNITNSDKIKLIELMTNDVVTYRTIGTGKAIYIGFDYYSTDPIASRILANAIKGGSSGPSWLSMPSTSVTVAPGDSSIIYLTFYSNGLAGGTYTTHVSINSNDPLHPHDSIAVTLNVGFNPCANFTFTPPSICSGIVAFQNSTVNATTSWSWNFGDASSSTLQNPVHTYTSAGTFQVRLVVCNGFVCDSITKSVTITSLSGPIASSCSPQTTSYCCGIGITQVMFNSINNSSSDGSVGYEDFSCSSSTSLTAGQTYPISVTTGTSYSENVNAWIDFNNDGFFDTITEVVFVSSYVTTYHSGNVFIPTTAVLNTPLRMRIGDDYSGNYPPSPCVDAMYGQFEDYTVVITPNTLPPISLFSSSQANICSGNVQFVDNSINIPTSWLWSFGDGTYSSIQNPSHQYLSSGTFLVNLHVTNAFGVNDYSQYVSINVLASTINYVGNLMVGQSIQFSIPTSGINTYLWNFGDGYLASLSTPQHVFSAPGTYYVSVLVSNGFCSTTLYDTLIIMPIGVNELTNGVNFAFSPNPFNQEIQLTYVLNNSNRVSLKAYDPLGQLIQTFVDESIQTQGKYEYVFKPKTSGVYFIHWIVDGNERLYKIVKLD